MSTYVLMTAAYNEEAHIEKTIRSVLAQTVRPERWVIVSDGSADRTDEIVRSYAQRYSFIRFGRVAKIAGHSFESKVRALRRATDELKGVFYSYIGNIDADLSVEAEYFERLLQRFREDPRLGLAGGYLYEDYGNGFRSRWNNNVNDVFHAAQLVRRECYEEIEGYRVLKYGGEDWVAQTHARMKDWKVEAIPNLRILHYRPTDSGTGLLRSALRQGKLDYSVGSDPLFEVVKCVRRFRERPYVLFSLLRLSGFIWLSINREERQVPEKFVRFLRKEQRKRLWAIVDHVRLGSLLPTRQEF